jgi:hypothetical protein
MSTLSQEAIDAINTKVVEYDRDAILSQDRYSSIYGNLVKAFTEGADTHNISISQEVLENLTLIHTVLLYNILVTVGNEQFSQFLPIIIFDILGAVINEPEMYLPEVPSNL